MVYKITSVFVLEQEINQMKRERMLRDIVEEKRESCSGMGGFW